MILAVDPGIASCGWAVVRPKTGRVLDLGVLVSKPAEGVDKSTDRARRIAWMADDLADVVEKYDCTAIAAEQMLFHGKINAVVSQLLPWGALLGLAAALDLDVLEVPAKTWQAAVLGRVVSYDQLAYELRVFVANQAELKLLAIARSQRTHALDAVGVGLYASFAKPTRVRSVMEAVEC